MSSKLHRGRAAGSKRRPGQALEPQPTFSRRPAAPPRLLRLAQADPRLLTAQEIFVLQQTVGNRAVGDLLGPQPPRRQFDPLGSRSEQEAERTARQVAGPGQAGLKQPPGRPTGGGTKPDAALERQIEQARGDGVPLRPGLRRQMEGAFGANFDRVKVHAGEQADRLARTVKARAFTIGADIFFRTDQYRPDSRPGQELLAHELTHVVQQQPQAGPSSRRQAAAQPQAAEVVQRARQKWTDQDDLDDYSSPAAGPARAARPLLEKKP